jgi:hypothetical protein
MLERCSCCRKQGCLPRYLYLISGVQASFSVLCHLVVSTILFPAKYADVCGSKIFHFSANDVGLLLGLDSLANRLYVHMAGAIVSAKHSCLIVC